jgi:hypothetical protein
VKHPKSSITIENCEPRVTLWNFARFAALLTLAMPVAMVVTAIVTGSNEVWAVGAFLWLVTIIAVWIVVLTFGCLVMIPVWFWRLGKRLGRQVAGKATPKGRLWDQWIDGPEPV